MALQYLGVPYVWAGATPRGFDCSGLVQYVFGQLGISLPHNTVAQWHDPAAVSVPRDELQPGDLVFFNGLDHVGIYIGSGYFVDAPHTGTDVRIDSLTEGWYAARYDGAKRILGAQTSGIPQAGGAADVHHLGRWRSFLVQRRLLHPLEGHGPRRTFRCTSRDPAYPHAPPRHGRRRCRPARERDDQPRRRQARRPQARGAQAKRQVLVVPDVRSQVFVFASGALEDGGLRLEGQGFRPRLSRERRLRPAAEARYARDRHGRADHHALALARERRRSSAGRRTARPTERA